MFKKIKKLILRKLNARVVFDLETSLLAENPDAFYGAVKVGWKTYYFSTREEMARILNELA